MADFGEGGEEFEAFIGMVESIAPNDLSELDRVEQDERNIEDLEVLADKGQIALESVLEIRKFLSHPDPAIVRATETTLQTIADASLIKPPGVN